MQPSSYRYDLYSYMCVNPWRAVPCCTAKQGNQPFLGTHGQSTDFLNKCAFTLDGQMIGFEHSKCNDQPLPTSQPSVKSRAVLCCPTCPMDASWNLTLLLNLGRNNNYVWSSSPPVPEILSTGALVCSEIWRAVPKASQSQAAGSTQHFKNWNWDWWCVPKLYLQHSITALCPKHWHHLQEPWHLQIHNYIYTLIYLLILD